MAHGGITPGTHYAVQQYVGDVREGVYVNGEWVTQSIWMHYADAARSIARRTRNADPLSVALRWRVMPTLSGS